jgi:hypothetical protein
MHAPYDKSRNNSSRTEPKSGLGFLILPVIVLFALVTLAIVSPKSSIWIAQAVEAEFGSGIAEDRPRSRA